MADITRIISAYGADGHGVNNSSSRRDSPPESVYTTSRQSADTLPRAAKRKFKSYRLRGAYEKPWLADPAIRKTRWNNWIVVGWMLLGFIGAALICFFSVRQYLTGPVCI
jgi:hypothetical protein